MMRQIQITLSPPAWVKPVEMAREWAQIAHVSMSAIRQDGREVIITIEGASAMWRHSNASCGGTRRDGKRLAMLFCPGELDATEPWSVLFFLRFPIYMRCRRHVARLQGENNSILAVAGSCGW